MKIQTCAALLLVCAGSWAADAPVTPRMADGHPDFNGTWDNGGGIAFLNPQRKPDGSVCVTGCPPVAAPAGAPAPGARLPPERPTYKPQYLGKVSELEKDQVKQDPILRCQPPGVPRIGPPDKIVQTATEILFLYEDVSGPFFRIVPLKPGVVRQDDSPSYLGDATGHWEGDTLVVETVKLHDMGWLDIWGSPITEKGKMIERFRRTSYGLLEIDVTIDDPTAYTEPFTFRVNQRIMPNAELIEFICAENDKFTTYLVGAGDK